MTKRYRELSSIESFEERFEYLVLKGTIGMYTFGFDRWLNQNFYTSRQWRDVRADVIVRDNGCDLGVAGYEIARQLLVHHLNPITPADITSGAEWILDPEYLITCSKRTHNAIHYGDASLLPKPLVDRRRGDTRLW